jgi:hypothetical protein
VYAVQYLVFNPVQWWLTPQRRYVSAKG